MKMFFYFSIISWFALNPLLGQNADSTDAKSLYLSFGYSSIPVLGVESAHLYTDLGIMFNNKFSANLFHHFSLNNTVAKNKTIYNSGIQITGLIPLSKINLTYGPIIGVSTDGLNDAWAMLYGGKIGLNKHFSETFSLSLEAKIDFLRYNKDFSPALNERRLYMSIYVSGFLP